MERDRSQNTPKKKKQPTVEDLGISEETCYFSLFPPIYILKQGHIVIFLMPLRSGGFSSQEDVGFHRVGHCWGKAASHQIITKKKKKKGFKKIGTNQTTTLGNAVPPWMAVA